MNRRDKQRRCGKLVRPRGRQRQTKAQVDENRKRQLASLIAYRPVMTPWQLIALW